MLFEYLNELLQTINNLLIPTITESVKNVPHYSDEELYVKKCEVLFLKSYEKESIDWNSNFSNDEKMWKSRVLIESTPRGNIIMFYDTFNEGFRYFIDTSGIPYKLLNAVAMKYVVIFRCRDFFLDENDIPEGNTSQCILNRRNLEQMEKAKKVTFVNNLTVEGYDGESPFAQLKCRVRKVDDCLPKEELTCKMRNRFIYQGKILNYKFLPVIETKKSVVRDESYKSYLLNRNSVFSDLMT